MLPDIVMIVSPSPEEVDAGTVIVFVEELFGSVKVFVDGSMV